MALTGQRIAMVDMVLLVFFQHFHIYRRGGWSQISLWRFSFLVLWAVVVDVFQFSVVVSTFLWSRISRVLVLQVDENWDKNWLNLVKTEFWEGFGKGSGKGSGGRVLRRFWEGSEKGLLWVLQKKGVLRRVLRRGSAKEASRRCLERPLGEYDPYRKRAEYGFAEYGFFNTELSEFFGFDRAPRRELSEFLSAYYLCAIANSPSFFSRTHRVCRKTQWGSVSSLLQNSNLETVFRPFPTLGVRPKIGKH